MNLQVGDLLYHKDIDSIGIISYVDLSRVSIYWSCFDSFAHMDLNDIRVIKLRAAYLDYVRTIAELDRISGDG